MLTINDFSPVSVLASLWLAAAPCGTTPPIGSSEYGFSTGVPRPGITVTRNGSVLSVVEAFGDRMFTVIRSTYDATTLTLLNSDRHADCCGSAWQSTISRNPDGSYDVEAQTWGLSMDNRDVLKESRPHLSVPPNERLVVGMLLLVPWIYHKTGEKEFETIDFNPLRSRIVDITEVAAAPYPSGVPARDHALRLSSWSQPAMTLWYDPCTFAVDAYGRSSDNAIIRSSLPQ